MACVNELFGWVGVGGRWLSFMYSDELCPMSGVGEDGGAVIGAVRDGKRDCLLRI